MNDNKNTKESNHKDYLQIRLMNGIRISRFSFQLSSNFDFFLLFFLTELAHLLASTSLPQTFLSSPLPFLLLLIQFLTFILPGPPLIVEFIFPGYLQRIKVGLPTRVQMKNNKTTRRGQTTKTLFTNPPHQRNKDQPIQLSSFF